tara:strand:+ start:643 stop:1035 length:393 start_codon:yes stop_codon:yes gene_type:complete
MKKTFHDLGLEASVASCELDRFICGEDNSYPEAVSKVVENLKENISSDRKPSDWGMGYFGIMLGVSKSLGYDFKKGDELAEYVLKMMDDLERVESIDDSGKVYLRDFCSELSMESTYHSIEDRRGYSRGI